MNPITLDNKRIVKAADQLQLATTTGQPVAPVRHLIGADGIAAAYAVQQELVARRIASGAQVVGRKIGLTAPVVQQQLRVDQPDFGYLFADMDVSRETHVPYSRLLQPKVEAEIAFALKTDLDAESLSEAQIRASIDYAVAALEIVDSRIADWDLTIADTVADNASSGLFVLGKDRHRLDEFDTRTVTMLMDTDGVQVSSGTGTACLGDPVLALVWLARTAVSFGEPLRAGQIILSGALGPMVAVKPGMRVHAEVRPLGGVSATFSVEDL
ncbi:fumarylacetoacetate hydrolase family protein [Mycobacterium intracellulare]|uniref:2-keto-4-pentenoate hydratase n=1 Tax=Mycobacterium intracellulare TaxID=1767 RepID=UPI00335FED2E